MENIDDLKNHPYFSGIDWEIVMKKGLEPPFEVDPEPRDLRRRVLRINDKDYSKDNYNFMRIKGFEFVREIEIDENLPKEGEHRKTQFDDLDGYEYD